MSMEFNRIITLLRKERGITQKEAAENLGVSQALLSHYEKGIRECGLEFVVRVADYYGVSCDYLLGRSPERTGQTLAVEDIPSPEQSHDSVYKGSILPTMNKKLIANSMNILFDKLSQAQNRELTNGVSSYLMLAVYKMFRQVYQSAGKNTASLFSVSQGRWQGYSDAALQRTAADVAAVLQGETVNEGAAPFKDAAAFEMTTESLTRDYPLYASSLLNLIKNSEHTIEK